MEYIRRPFLNGFIVACALSIGFMLFKPFYLVDPGETAIHLRLSRIRSAHKESGAYFKIPFIDSIVRINNRISKAEIETTALTKDLQTVSIEVAINYKISETIDLYKNVGVNFEEIIINPFAQETIKAVVAKFTAEDLIQSRHEAKELVFIDLQARLIPVYIEFIDFNFVHLDFSSEFIHSVEQKQIAEQSALTAKNLTEKVKEEALQTKARAEAEAYSLNVQKTAVTDAMIELKKIEKWDGHLPMYVGSGTPLITIK